jgi:hypothetical protein
MWMEHLRSLAKIMSKFNKLSAYLEGYFFSVLRLRSI